jgi:hypothetical protein
MSSRRPSFLMQLTTPHQASSDVGRLQRRITQFGRDQGLALFEQEYMCSFEAAVLGSLYVEELRLARESGRIGKVPVDRIVPVQTAWDLGYDDATAIWFIQVVGREVRLVDYYEGNEAGFEHYARILDDKAREHGWRYGEHWFPHDTAHHELSTGVSRADTLRTLGIDPTIVPVSYVMDGVNGVRRLLSRSWIDEQRCERGLAALQNYRREWEDERKVLKAKPVHDWSSNGADALRTFAEGFGDSTSPLPGRRYYQAQPVSRTTSWAA